MTSIHSHLQAEGGDRISSGSTAGRPGEPFAIAAPQRQPVGGRQATLDLGASCSSVLTWADRSPPAAGSREGSGRRAFSGSGPAEDGVRFSVLRFGDGSTFRAPVRHPGGGGSLAHSSGAATQKEVIDICDSDTDNADVLALPAPGSPASPVAPARSNHAGRDCLEDDMPGDPPQSSPSRPGAQHGAGSKHTASPIRRTGGQPSTPQTSPRVLKRIRHPGPEDGGEPAAQRPAVGGHTPGRVGSGGAAAEGGKQLCPWGLFDCHSCQTLVQGP